MPKEIEGKYLLVGSSTAIADRNRAIDWKNTFPKSKVYKITQVEEVEFEITEKVK